MKKRGSTFVIITLENLDGFFNIFKYLQTRTNASIQQRVYETRVHDIDELRQVCCVFGAVAD